MFSDLHLGSRQSTRSVKDIIAVCNQFNPSKILFVGDIIDLMLDEKNSKLLKELRAGLSSFSTEMVDGNHDKTYGISFWDGKLEGFTIRIFHGHQYEDKITTTLNPILVKINEWILKVFNINFQQLLRELTTKEYPEGSFPTKLYQQRSEVLKHGFGVDILASGHTHCPEVTKMTDLWYCNPGNWETFIKIDADGPKLMYFKDVLDGND